jgi:hypothetical protein
MEALGKVRSLSRAKQEVIDCLTYVEKILEKEKNKVLFE